MSDLAGNSEDQFSSVMAQIGISFTLRIFLMIIRIIQTFSTVALKYHRTGNLNQETKNQTKDYILACLCVKSDALHLNHVLKAMRYKFYL